MQPALAEGRAGAKMRVGLAQIDAELGDVAANLRKTKAIIDEHRGRVDLLVFPELSLTGYDVKERYHELALRLEDEVFADLVRHTAGIAVQVGFIEETPSFSFFNSMALLRDGRLDSVHRKIFLPNYGIFEERKYFSPGQSYELQDLAGFRIAPFICADAWNPALAHVAAADRAQIFVLSVCSPDGGLGSRLSSREGWQRLNRFYAAMYGVYVVFVNRAGAEHDLRFWGGSEVIDPFGQPIAAAAGDGEQIVLAEIHHATIREARTVLHTIRDDDPRFIGRQLDRIVKKYHE